MRRPTHDTEKFEEYIDFNGPEGVGFILQLQDIEEVYIFDDYGGWVDRSLNYYNSKGQPAGYFDQDYNFYDMKGIRIPGGYKGGKDIERRVLEKRKYLEKIPDNQRIKFVIEFQNLPDSTTSSQIVNYITERCNIMAELIIESKKTQKDPSKGYVVVQGAAIVNKILILEGRSFRIKEKDGKYTSREISLFVRQSKYNNNNKYQDDSVSPHKQGRDFGIENNDDDDVFKIQIEGVDINKSNQELLEWLSSVCSFAQKDVILTRSSKSTIGLIQVQDEELKYRILKMNGRRFGESNIQFTTSK